MFATPYGRRLAAYAAIVFTLTLVAVVAIWWVFFDTGAKRITAYFSEAIGVYAGSTVRVLGVPVGTIDSITPSGRQVRVEMTLDDDVAVPANAQAVVIEPSVVSDRYIQLTPAYDGGQQLADGAVIPAARTATPIEIDQLYRSLNQLAGELGPNGANKDGALSDLLNTAAANLKGNGATLGNTIAQLGAATRTLSGSQNDLFSTVDNLQQFTTMLANNDGQVRSAEQQLASVASFLSADRDDLGAALNELATALGQVQGFVQSNRAHLRSNVGKLAAITQLLVNQRASLGEALDDLPLAVTNMINAYDPDTHTLDGRANLLEFSQPSAARSNTAACANVSVACQQSAPASATSNGPVLPLPNVDAGGGA